MREDLDSQAQARVGAWITEKYRLERLIGCGGMASVYAGVHRNRNRVAIKILHPHLSIDTDLRARFLREGYVANRVDHPGAVRVLDDDTADDGAVFLVMELLEGVTLDERWKRAGLRLPQQEVCELASQLLDVLAAAHAQGIVHRDIKPENLFLTREGVLKVLDFGIARLQEAGASHGPTQTGRMLGTPAFMPPEQALGRSREIDGQTDVWAVGATMFTLLTGHPVHEAETMQEMLVNAASQPARLLASLLPELPQGIAQVIDRALAFRKVERWSDARAMEAALGAAYRLCFGTVLPQNRAPSAPAIVAAFPVKPLTAPRALIAPAETARSGTQLASPGAQAIAWAPPPFPNDSSTTGGLASEGARAAPPSPPRAASRTVSRPALWAGVAAALVLASGVVVVVKLRATHAEEAKAFSASGIVTGASAGPRAIVSPPTSSATASSIASNAFSDASEASLSAGREPSAGPEPSAVREPKPKSRPATNRLTTPVVAVPVTTSILQPAPPVSAAPQTAMSPFT